jgi:hypothetical protein
MLIPQKSRPGLKEPTNYRGWEYNPEGKSSEDLAAEYGDLIGPHTLEEGSGTTVTEPKTR